MLRVTCSRVVRCAFRAAASPRIVVSPRINNAFVSAANSDRRFSTTSFGCWANGTVVAALDSEINIIQLIKERPAPPPYFTLKTERISPSDGQVHVLLTRKLDGEEIDVRLLDDNSSSDEAAADVESPEKTVPLKIEITKRNGKSLKFAAAASADGILIDGLTTKEGTKVICSQLSIERDSELEMALREFLAVRGIEKSMAGFLYDLTIWKSKILEEESSGRNDPEQLNKLRKLKEVIRACFSNAVSESPTISDRHFSTCSGSGRKVVEALKSEIESHDLALMKSRGLPANIPFSIWDDPGYMHITMNRDLGKEKIEVTVHPIDHPSRHGDNDDDDDDDLSAEEEKAVYINVSISKKKKGTLDLGAHVSADEIVLDRVSYSERNSFADPFRYMVGKEGNVQDAFREFVKSRGIEKSNVGFLYNYMLKKRQDWANVWTPLKKPKPETDDLKILKIFFEKW